MNDETTQTPPPRRPPRPAPRRPAPRKPAASTPPNRVEPGWVHEALAGATLRAVRDSANLDVGQLADDFVARVPGAGEDGPEPAVLLARIYAHTAHRLPLLKRFEKRLEGKDLRSGMGSDVLALAAQLYLRNRDLVPSALALVRKAAQDRAEKRAAGGAESNGAGPVPAGHWPDHSSAQPAER